MSTSGTGPRVSVVIATMGRPDSLVRAVASVLARDDPDMELCVVDQSATDATARALQPFERDPRYSLVRLVPGRGLGAARNAGVAHTTAPIVAFTDDDCEVEPGWLGAARERFVDPRVGMLFGTVRAAAYDRSQGLTPAYVVSRLTHEQGLSAKARIEGIGACMFVRRDVWQALGGFDEWMGSGAPLRAAEDSDFAMRALARGYVVCEDPSVAVRHHGFRSWAQRDGLVTGYMIGLGAMHAKMLRFGGPAALKPLWDVAVRFLFGAPVVDLNGVPPRLLRLRAFLRGAWRGLRMPLDPSTGRFLEPDSRVERARAVGEVMPES